LESQDKREDDAPKKYDERIFELYDDRYKTFQKGFSLLMGLSLIFLFIILFPYISIQQEEYKINGILKNVSTEIEDIQKSIDAYPNILNGINLLRGKINESPQDLRSFIQKLTLKIDTCLNLGISDNNFSVQSNEAMPAQQSNEAMPAQQSNEAMPAQQSNEYNECYTILPNGTENEKYKVTQVNDKIKNQYNEYEKIINENISEPLKIFSKKSQYVENVENYTQGLKELKNKMNKTIHEDQNFWRTVPGKVETFGTLVKQVTSFYIKYNEPIQHQLEEMKKKFDGLKENKTELVQFQRNLNFSKQQISERINQIEIPFGKIPFGLSESISVFPLALGIGFSVCASLLSNATIFRKALHEWYSSQSIDKSSSLHHKIPIIAPLWIDPLKPKYNQIINFMILVIPFILFIISLQLILYSWSIPHVNSTEITFPIDKNSYHTLYTIFYIISFLLFIFSYFRLALHIYNYKLKR
jgi:hypothetical protein